MNNKNCKTQEKTISVVGLGMLGRSIATCLLGHGLQVVGYARHKEEHSEARRYITEGIEDLIVRAGFPPSLREEWTNRYTETQSYEPLRDCQFVIESVTEDLTVKQEVFDNVEEVVEASVPIASNTSALPIKLLQHNRRHPERFIGMHWVEPSHATQFMELICGEQTSDETLEAAVALAKHAGKDPSIVQKDVPGFIVNRMGYAVYREALHMLETGVADAETIDRSFRNAFGLWASMCGPLRWIDLTGGPALYAQGFRNVAGSLNNDTEVPASLQELANEDAHGIANGHGFYRYTEEEIAMWKEKFRDHAWTVRELINQDDPMKNKPCD